MRPDALGVWPARIYERQDRMAAALFTIAGFLLGSIPFSLLVGRLFASKDIRSVGDGNPGAANAWKAGGWKAGLAGGLLDYAKGAVPVALAHYAAGVTGWALVPVALAPVLGHAYSPFLKGRGGKAILVTFGIWTGVVSFWGPLVFGALLGIFYLVQDENAWSVMLGMTAFLVFLIIREPELYIVAIWAGNMAVLAQKHGKGLRNSMRWKPYLLKLFGRTA